MAEFFRNIFARAQSIGIFYLDKDGLKSVLAKLDLKYLKKADAPFNGTFALEVDVQGNLYCVCPDSANLPTFEIDANNNVYLVIK